MSEEALLAIDFGTSRTKAAYFDEVQKRPELVEIGRNIRTMIPSAFYVPQPVDGNINDAQILVGDDAEEMLDEDPDGYVIALKKEIHKTGFKRLDGGRKIERIDLASHLFKFIKEHTESTVTYFIDRKIGACVLTVPVSFSTVQREAIRQAAERGGLSNIKIVEEPVAAACAWLAETHQQGIEHVIVCDIGGGTTDFAIVRLNHGIFQPVPEIPTKGLNWGGDDLDEQIIERIRDNADDSTDEKQNFWQRITNWQGAFKSRIRRIKELLTRHQKDIYEAKVQDVKLSVSQNEISNCVDKFVEQVCDEFEQYLTQCYEKLNRRDIPVLLVGGSSQLRGLEEKVKKIAGENNVYRWIRSEYAIVLGATLEGKNITTQKPTQQPTQEPTTKNNSENLNTNKIDAEAEYQLGLKCDDEKDYGNAIKHYLNAAEQGHACAQRELGCYYRDGIGIVSNPSEAVKWLRKSSEQGNAGGQINLALAYLNGVGCVPDVQEAERWFSEALKSANPEDKDEQIIYGLCYQFGVGGVEQDLTESAKWYRKSAEQNNTISQCHLGLCYRDGKGVTQDSTEAVKWFRKAAEQDDATGQTWLGIFYFYGDGVTQDLQESIRWFRKSAEQENAEGQFWLGVFYHDGIGVTQNFQEAVKWFRKSSEQGNSNGQVRLGMCYRDGSGVTQDFREAIKWFRKAAEQGDTNGQCHLGDCYLNGPEIIRNIPEGIRWYRQAAEQGDSMAQYNLGLAYLEGTGVVKNAWEAIQWFHKAAEQGHPDGQHWLGLCYLNGVGTTLDRDEAYKWLLASSESGSMLGMYFEIDILLSNFTDESRTRIKQLVNAGANLNYDKDGFGNTPLHVAVRDDWEYERIRFLKQLGASHTIANKEGKTALQLAEERLLGADEVVKILRGY
jgi:TPR repeat protein/actin-like ATPase involved in cell morphogenesis